MKLNVRKNILTSLFMIVLIINIFVKTNVLAEQFSGKNNVGKVLFLKKIDIDYGLYILKGEYKTEDGGKILLKYTVTDSTGKIAKEVSKVLMPAENRQRFSIPINIWRSYKKVFRYKPGKLFVKLFGEKGKDVYCENVTLTKSNDPIILRLFPAEYERNETVPFVKGVPNFFRIMLIGDKNKLVGKKAEIEIDMPEGTDDYGEFGGGERIIINNEKYIRFNIPVEKDQIEKLKTKTGHASVTCWFNIDNIKKARKIFYKVVINGKPYTLKEVSIKILPALPTGPRSKRFKRMVSWATFGETYKGTAVNNNFMPEKIFPDVYNLIHSIGLNAFLIFSPQKPSGGWRKYIFEQIKKDGARIWANIPPGFYEKFISGKGWETRIINGGIKGIADMSGDYFVKMKELNLADDIHFDFEPRNAEESPLWDDIPTKKMFAKKYGYDFSKLTKKRLQGKLRWQWMTFRTWQIGEALRLWAEYVHSINPNWGITVSQGNGKPGKHVDYGFYLDIPKIVHMPQIYTSNSMYVTRTIISLKERYPGAVFYPVITATMVADKGWPAISSPQTFYSQLVSIAMLGCYGAAQWPDIRRGMDMEYIWEMARATRDIAYLEDFVYDGNVVNDIDIMPNDTGNVNWEENSFSRAYKLNGKILIAFNNINESKNADVKIKFKNIEGNNWKVVNPVTNKIIPSSTGELWNADELKNNLTYTVPAATLGMLVVSKE